MDICVKIHITFRKLSSLTDGKVCLIREDTHEINIRDAYEDDIQDIIYLRRQLDDFHAEMRPDVFISSNLYDEEDIKSYLETKKSRVIIIENPTNEIIGYAVLNTERVEKILFLIIELLFM